MENRKRVVIVGSGNAAEALACALTRTDHYVVTQIFARNREKGSALAEKTGCGWENRTEKLAPAEIYLLAVSDKAIPEVSETLAFGNALVAHTSGSVNLSEICSRIDRRGVFYPLQTFTAGRTVDFSTIPVFVEAEREADYHELEKLGRAVSGSVRRGDSLLRQKLHLAAVFVCNFVNDMYVVGERWMEENGMDFSVLKPLIAETTRKMLDSRSAFDIQTGPAVREDGPTIEKHLKQLEPHPDLQKIYELLTDHIIKMKNSDGKL